MTAEDDRREWQSDSERWFPGKACWAPIPDCHSGSMQAERLEVVQTYKGFTLVACRNKDCGAHMVFDTNDPDTIWHCEPCARKKFQNAYPNVTAIGRRVVSSRYVYRNAA